MKVERLAVIELAPAEVAEAIEFFVKSKFPKLGALKTAYIQLGHNQITEWPSVSLRFEAPLEK